MTTIISEISSPFLKNIRCDLALLKLKYQRDSIFYLYLYKLTSEKIVCSKRVQKLL